MHGCRPLIFAGLVAVSATNRLTSIRPLTTPSENGSGSRVSSPGMPFGIFVNGIEGSTPVIGWVSSQMCSERNRETRANCCRLWVSV